MTISPSEIRKILEDHSRWLATRWTSKVEGKRADLTGAVLTGADLTRAVLTGADLTRADLTRADLTGADLRPIKHDLWGVLVQAIPEVPAFRQALIDGKVDGSTYQGACSCLCGTIGRTRGIADPSTLSFANSDSAIERFVMGIREGDTPETNVLSKIVLEWTDEFLTFIPAR